MSQAAMMFLIIFPIVAAPLCYWLGLKDKHRRDNGVAIATWIELTFAVLLVISGEGYVRIALVQDEDVIRQAAMAIKDSGMLG